MANREWRHCDDGHRCPVCEANGRGACLNEENSFCKYNPDFELSDTVRILAYMCMKRCGDEAAPGWKVLTRPSVEGHRQVLIKGGTQGDGAVYVEDHVDCVNLDKPQTEEQRAAAAAKRAERDAESESFREDARRKAKAKWKLCGDTTVVGTMPGCLDGRGPHHPRLAAYVEARGVKIEDLPGGELPRTIKFHGALRDGMNVAKKGELKRMVFFELPTMVCLAVRKDRKFGGVQRIYLDPSGRAAKAPPPEGVDEKKWDPKRAQGSLTAAAVRLHSPPVSGGGVLILCEGIETGLACLAATHAGVWACVSTAGLLNVELPDEYVCEHGAVETVIIAADCDRAKKKGNKPGQDAAAECARRLASMYPQLTIRIAIPSINEAPELFDAFGQPNGKSVDWLDIYNAVGKGRVREALLERSICHHRGFGEGVAGGGSWGGDEGRGVAMLGGDRGEIPEGDLPMARTLLLDWRDFSPEPEDRPNQRHYVVRTGGNAYRYLQGDRPRWAPVGDESLRGLVWTRLQRYKVWSTDGERLAPLNPPKKTVDAVFAAMMAEVAVETPATSVWIHETYDNRGKAVWRGEKAYVDPTPADWFIPCSNGILDVNALVDGVVKLQPHTPRLFSLSCRPFDVDVDLLKRLIRATDEEAEAIGKEYWPAFANYLSMVSGGDREWVELLQRATGLALTPDTSYEKIFLLPGPPGSGKGTYLEVLSAIVGEEGFATTTLSSIAKDFGLVPLVGKNVVALSDAGAGRYTDAGQALEMLKMLSGGDKVTVEYKGKNEMPTLKLPLKIFIATNKLPKLPDSAGALERRLVPIPFSIALGPAMDRAVKPKVISEAKWIFLWGLRGLVRLRRDPGGFNLTRAGQILVQEIKEGNEPMFTFLEEECELGGRYRVVKADFREAYNRWAEENGHPSPLSASAITSTLRAVCPLVQSGQLGSGKRSHTYDGVKLRDSGMTLPGIPHASTTSPAEPLGGESPPDPLSEDEPPF